MSELLKPLPGWQKSLIRYLSQIADQNSGGLPQVKRKAICRAAAMHVADLPRSAPVLRLLFSAGHGGSEFMASPSQQEVIQSLPDLPLSGEDDVLVLLAGAEYARHKAALSSARGAQEQAKAEVETQQVYVNRLEQTVAALKAERDQLHRETGGYRDAVEAKDEQLATRNAEVKYFEELTEMLSRSGLSAAEAAPPSKKRRERVEGHPGIYKRKTLAGTVYEIVTKKAGQTSYLKAGSSLEAAIKLRAELRGENPEKVLD